MRKITALLLALLLSPAPSYAAVAFVQGTGVSAGGAPVASVSKSITVTGGNAIVVVGMCATGGCTGSSVWNDDKSNSYSVIETGTGYCNMAVATNVAAGATNITLTPNVGSDYLAFAVAEFSGINTTPADGHDSNPFGSAADPTTPSLTTSASGVTIGGLNYLQYPQTLTEGGGYTLIYEDENQGVNVVYKLTSAGSQQASWTAVAAPINGWVTCIMGLKAAASGRRPVGAMVFP